MLSPDDFPSDITRIGRAPTGSSFFQTNVNISDLAHRVGHDIGNPLTSIISLATVIQRSALDYEKNPPSAAILEKYAAYSGSMIDEAWRIRNITERLVLLLSEREINQARQWLPEVVAKAVAKFKKLSRFQQLKFQVDSDAQIGEVPLDSEQFSALLQELLANAGDAVLRSKLSAPLALLHQQHEADIAIRLSSNASGIQLSITNLSTLSCPLGLDEIFKPFVKSHDETGKLGLGLNVCQAIVSRFGGELVVKETPIELGFAFAAIVSLPPEKGVKASPPRQTSVENQDRAAGDWTEIDSVLPSAINILIVDDEPTVASAIQKIIELPFAKKTKLHFDICSGLEVIDLLENGKRFDVILCDLNLKGTSGRDVYDIIAHRFPETRDKVAFLTGDRDSENQQLYLVTSGRPYLYKPFEPKQLVDMVLGIIR